MKIIIYLTLVIFLNTADICNALSVSELKKGQFIVDVKQEQKISLISNNAKLSDILNFISDKMNIDVKIEKASGEQLVTAEIKDSFLADVLPRIVNGNYYIFLKDINNKTVVSAMATEPDSLLGTRNTDNKKSVYIFPIHPGMKEWQQFNTVQEMYNATQIPEHILHDMGTDNLITTCLNYPLLINISAFNTLQEGMYSLVKNFNGLEELLNRKDAGDKLFSKYQQLDSEEVIREDATWSPEQKNDFIVKSIFLEMLLAQDKIISGISSHQRIALVKEALDKFEIKSKLRS
jgi:hypothetical protein